MVKDLYLKESWKVKERKGFVKFPSFFFPPIPKIGTGGLVSRLSFSFARQTTKDTRGTERTQETRK